MAAVLEYVIVSDMFYLCRDRRFWSPFASDAARFQTVVEGLQALEANGDRRPYGGIRRDGTERVPEKPYLRPLIAAAREER